MSSSEQHGLGQRPVPPQVRERASTETFKAGASECLMVMSLLRHLVETIILPTSRLLETCCSFLAVCDLDGLAATMKIHLDAHKEAYGTDYVWPKNYFSFHRASRIYRD